MIKINIIKSFLIKEYIKNKKSCLKIAKILNCSNSSIYHYLKKYKIKIRTPKQARKLLNITGENNGRYIDNRTHNKYFCKNCEKLINYRTAIKGQGRCQSCAKKGKYNGKFNPNYKDGRSLEPKYCIGCGKEINWQHKRCHECNNKFYSGTNHWCYIDGLSLKSYPLGWNKTFKKQIRYRDGYRCQICGKTEIECLRKLDIHHIDYNKNNLNPNNLISLCKSCHCKTNYNRNIYIEYFRILINIIRRFENGI